MVISNLERRGETGDNEVYLRQVRINIEPIMELCGKNK